MTILKETRNLLDESPTTHIYGVRAMVTKIALLASSCLTLAIGFAGCLPPPAVTPNPGTTAATSPAAKTPDCPDGQKLFGGMFCHPCDINIKVQLSACATSAEAASSIIQAKLRSMGAACMNAVSN